MRTTVDLDDKLFRQAKAQAAMEGIPLKDLLERGVRLALETSTSTKKRRRIKLPLWGNVKMGKLDIPDDIASRSQEREDRERYEASL